MVYEGDYANICDEDDKYLGIYVQKMRRLQSKRQ